MYDIYIYQSIDLSEIGRTEFSEIDFEEISPDIMIGVEDLPNYEQDYGGKVIYFLYKYGGLKKANTYRLTFDYEKFLIGEFIYETINPQSAERHHPEGAFFGMVAWSDDFGLTPGVVMVKVELENKELCIGGEEIHNTINLSLNDVEKYTINVDEVGGTKTVYVS